MLIFSSSARNRSFQQYPVKTDIIFEFAIEYLWPILLAMANNKSGQFGCNMTN